MVTAVHEENKKRSLAQIETEFKSRKKTTASEGVTVEALKDAMTDVK